MFEVKEFEKGLRGYEVYRARLKFWHGVSEFSDKRAKKIQKKMADKVLKAMRKSGMNDVEKLMLANMICAALAETESNFERRR